MRKENKTRISATVDPETKRKIEGVIKEGPYRNISHVVEEAIKFFCEVKFGKHKK